MNVLPRIYVFVRGKYFYVHFNKFISCQNTILL